MKLPKTILPCPIVESTLEIRFQTNLPPDTMVGFVYSLFQSKDSEVQLTALPISQIPAEIRRQDPNLKYKPTHRLHTKEYDALVGSNVVVLTIPGIYVGWNKFKSNITDFIQTIQSNIIGKIEYIGLRYLNFFAFDIFDRIKLNVGGDNFSRGFPSVFKSEYKKDYCTNVLQITNGVHLQNPQMNIDADGSLIDITVVLVNNHLTDVNFENIVERIDSAHLEAKTVFFSLLSDDYLNELGPQYE